MNNKKLLSTIASLITFFGAGIFLAHAQNYVPLANLPGTTIEGTNATDLSTYITGAIRLLIALGAALAILYAIIGGTQYVAAGISPDAKSGAKDRIVNAVIGLALILSSYLILNSINPALVNFNLTLDSVTVTNIAGSTSSNGGGGVPNLATAPTNCPEMPQEVVNNWGTLSTEARQAYYDLYHCGNSSPQSLCPITSPDFSLVDASIDPAAADMEAGNTIVWTSSDPTIQANLNNLKAQVTKLQLALAQPPINGSVTVTSAYRPYNYQKHLYQLVKAWVTDDLQNNTDPLCADLRVKVGADYAHHHLMGVAADPDSSPSNHMNGTGVDLAPSSNINYADFTRYGNYHWTDINSYMSYNADGIMLAWQNLANDPVHFKLRQ